jgi:hypothetical protein
MLGDESLTYPIDILLHGDLDFCRPITVLTQCDSLILVGDRQYHISIIPCTYHLLTELWPSFHLSSMGTSQGYAV